MFWIKYRNFNPTMGGVGTRLQKYGKCGSKVFASSSIIVTLAFPWPSAPIATRFH
jgi:hypothetical protein